MVERAQPTPPKDDISPEPNESFVEWSKRIDKILEERRRANQ